MNEYGEAARNLADHIDADLLALAGREFEDTGTIASDTYMALNNAGINADILLAQLAGEINYG